MCVCVCFAGIQSDPQRWRKSHTASSRQMGSLSTSLNKDLVGNEVERVVLFAAFLFFSRISAWTIFAWICTTQNKYPSIAAAEIPRKVLISLLNTKAHRRRWGFFSLFWVACFFPRFVLHAGPIVLLLHGFPEVWYTWRHQMPALAKAGFHAIAMDMRGYGESEAPVGVEQYTLFHVVGDIIGLLDALHVQQVGTQYSSAINKHSESQNIFFPLWQDLLSEIFVPDFLDDFHLPLLCILLILNLHYQVFLVGHDWGSNIGWDVCRLRPDRIIAYVSVSVPFNVRAPDNSGINKAVAILGEGFYWNRFQVSSRGSILSSFLQILESMVAPAVNPKTYTMHLLCIFCITIRGPRKYVCLFVCFLDTFNKED